MLSKAEWTKFEELLGAISAYISLGHVDHAKKGIEELKGLVPNLPRDIASNTLTKIKAWEKILGIEEPDIVTAQRECLEARQMVEEALKLMKSFSTELDKRIQGLEQALK